MAPPVARFDAGGQFSRRADSLDQPISDNDCMVIKYVVAGIDPAVG